MDFKKMSLKSIFSVLLLGLLLIGLLIWKSFSKTDLPSNDHNQSQNSVQNELIKVSDVNIKGSTPNSGPSPQIVSEPVSDVNNEVDAAIQEQLDRDRQQQKQTKDLRIALEQTNLELEQEKALAEINKLKKENTGAFNEPTVDSQKNLPEIKVDYIGGDKVKKEAIISIAGTNYQVREKSNPTVNIQVVSISDSSVTLHFSVPKDLTKTFDYKPE